VSKSIYKYVGLTSLEKVIASDEHVTLKCTYPKDFNDPYELFLTINFNEEPDDLAFYSDAIGTLTQLPTTCFSLSPAVVPMWAHYTQNHEGFVIDFDEEKLADTFPESCFGDVDYLDNTSPGLTEMLYQASRIGKPRYVYFLRKWVFSAAYFTKTKAWSYEQERRMVVQESETRRVNDIILMDVPKDCVKSLIAGPRASQETVDAVRKKAHDLGCAYFQLQIGRSSAAPFFIDSAGNPFIFDGKNIVASSQYCSSCREPISVQAKECSWCQIEDSHMLAAAHRNPYRMYHSYGLLDSYIQAMDNVGRDK